MAKTKVKIKKQQKKPADEQESAVIEEPESPLPEEGQGEAVEKKKRKSEKASPEILAMVRRMIEAGEITVFPDSHYGLNSKYKTLMYPTHKGEAGPPTGQGEWISHVIIDDWISQGVIELVGDKGIPTAKARAGDVNDTRGSSRNNKPSSDDEDAGLVFEEAGEKIESHTGDQEAAQRLKKGAQVKLTGSIKLKGKEGMALKAWGTLHDKVATVEGLAMVADVPESSAKFCIRKAVAAGAARVIE